jgi:hypothetical protein
VTRTIDGEVIAVHIEPTPSLWLRLVAYWPSLLLVVVGVSLIVGAR